MGDVVCLGGRIAVFVVLIAAVDGDCGLELRGPICVANLRLRPRRLHRALELVDSVLGALLCFDHDRQDVLVRAAVSLVVELGSAFWPRDDDAELVDGVVARHCLDGGRDERLHLPMAENQLAVFAVKVPLFDCRVCFESVHHRDFSRTTTHPPNINSDFRILRQRRIDCHVIRLEAQHSSIVIIDDGDRSFDDLPESSSDLLTTIHGKDLGLRQSEEEILVVLIRVVVDDFDLDESLALVFCEIYPA
mmetsp:Transcript_78540/g.225078  ORF Transcript_78540/g.225078 Transcript_78540/m.225078 type:complete len:248 (+) Transcript_78540:924-1667(+)